MRTEAEIKERIQLAIIEQINNMNFKAICNEPENLVPIFITILTEKIHEICLDEIMIRRRY